MNLPNINPTFNASSSDHSKVDESINQDGPITIHATGNATINSNSGNGSRDNKVGVNALFQVLAVSIICDILVCGLILLNAHFSYVDLEEKADARHADIQKQMQLQQESVQKQMEVMRTNNEHSMQVAKEGTIWILRRDILNSIDVYTRCHTITVNQYKRLKDQFDYYRSIGGNHDVEGRFSDFTTKIFGTNEIVMTPDPEGSKR